MGYPLERLDYPDWLEALRESRSESQRRDADGDDVVGGILGGATPETSELWDGNIYDDYNTRRALRGSGLRRPSWTPRSSATT